MTFLEVFQDRFPHWSHKITLIYICSVVFIMIIFAIVKMSAKRWVIGFALHAYVYNVLVTVLLMRDKYDFYRFDFRAFYQFKEVFYNNDTLLKYELILNILMFVPIGFLLSLFLKGWSRFLISGALCVMFTLFIETTQLFTRLGEFQTDDIIANSMGGIIGAFTAFVFYKIFLDKEEEDSP